MDFSANNGIDLLNSFVGRHPFSAVAADHDTGRRAKLQGRTQEEMEILEQQRKYIYFYYITNYNGFYLFLCNKYILYR